MKRKTISLVTIDNVGEQIANIDISHGATCSPNPETEALDYEQEQTIVVTAQNGIDKATYTVKKIFRKNCCRYPPRKR